MTPKETLLAAMADLGLSVKAEFVPFSQSRNAQNKDRSLNWRITLLQGKREILTTNYSAGIAACPSYKQGPMSVDMAAAIKAETETGLASRILAGGVRVAARSGPIRPDYADVVYALVQDASVLDEGSFEDWASSLGYDTDSRKAEAIYRACLDIALKLRNGIGEDGMAKLREACQDY